MTPFPFFKQEIKELWDKKQAKQNVFFLFNTQIFLVGPTYVSRKKQSDPYISLKKWKTKTRMITERKKYQKCFFPITTPT